MKNFLLVYRGSVQPENGQKHMSDWNQWMKGMGDAVVDAGVPVMPSKTITSKQIAGTHSKNPICGMSIIQAIDMDTALDLAKVCPHITIGGSIEVAETMNLPMD